MPELHRLFGLSDRWCRSNCPLVTASTGSPSCAFECDIPAFSQEFTCHSAKCWKLRFARSTASRAPDSAAQWIAFPALFTPFLDVIRPLVLGNTEDLVSASRLGSTKTAVDSAHSGDRRQNLAPEPCETAARQSSLSHFHSNFRAHLLSWWAIVLAPVAAFSECCPQWAPCWVFESWIWLSHHSADSTRLLLCPLIGGGSNLADFGRGTLL